MEFVYLIALTVLIYVYDTLTPHPSPPIKIHKRNKASKIKLLKKYANNKNYYNIIQNVETIYSKRNCENLMFLYDSLTLCK